MTTPTGPGGTPDPLLGGAGGTSGATAAGTGYPTGGTGGSGGTTEQAKQAAGTAKEQGQQVAGVAKEEGQHVAGVAKEEASNVAGVAKEEASNVAGEAKAQARNLVEELRSQATEQSSSALDRLASTLRELGDELEEMATCSSNPGMASQVARQVADRSRSASSFMQQHEPGDLVDEVRRFAGRRPGAFLLGALAAGVAAGRLSRGAAKAHGVGPEKPDTSTEIMPAGTTGTTVGTAGTGTGYGTGAGYGTGTTVVPPVGAPADTGVTGPAPTGPAVDPVEPGYGGVPVPGTGRPGGTTR